MHNIKVNQVYVAPLMGGRTLRKVRILAPHPDGDYIVQVIPVGRQSLNADIVRMTAFGLDKAYKLETDVCEHKHIDDAYIDSGGFSPPVPNYHRCLDCGDLFPNMGDTALWFPKPLERVSTNG